MNTLKKLKKTIYDLEGNGLEIAVMYDVVYDTVDEILSAHAVKFGKRESVDLTFIMSEHFGLDKQVDEINWREVLAQEKADDRYFEQARAIITHHAQSFRH